MSITRSAAVLATSATLAAVALAPAPAGSAVAPPQPRHHGHAESAQVVLDWERTLLRTVYTEHVTPIPVGIPSLGFTSMAMHDAATRARHQHRRASAAAAVARAAHDVLVEYFPASTDALDADLATSLASVPDGPAEDRGVRAGQRAAAKMIASRADDGRGDASVVYARTPAPGVWQPAAGAAMVAPWLGFVDPLVSRRPIRVNGPDPIDSAEYAADLLEVKRVGRATDADRTDHQTETAMFFNSNPPVMYTDALVRHLETRPLGLLATTRLFARMHGAMTDSVITVWRLKYDVGFWRPFQAIQGAADDGNPATVPDPAWAPLVPNPQYADYVSGHAGMTGPAAAVIRRTLGDATPLLLRSPVTGTEREYATLSELEFDAFHARIWGGLHFRDAMEDGYRIGHVAARRAMARID